MTARVVVLSKPGCHLCDDADEVVAGVADDLGVEWESRDISNDADLLAQWGEYVPVVLVDGDVLTWFRVQPEQLRLALTS